MTAIERFTREGIAKVTDQEIEMNGMGMDCVNQAIRKVENHCRKTYAVEHVLSSSCGEKKAIQTVRRSLACESKGEVYSDKIN